LTFLIPFFYKLKTRTVFKKPSSNLITAESLEFDIILYKESCTNESFCHTSEDRINYQRIENALCGKTKYYSREMYCHWEGPSLHPKRIRVNSMK
jgi:hypothetical protein